MNTVPYRFIESVFQACGDDVLQKLPKLSSLWGTLAEEYKKKSGRLEVAYTQDDQNEWCLCYKLVGFDHIRARTLSREVVREISKSITLVEFSVISSNILRQGWTKVSSNDEKEMLQLLTRLDAPEKKLDLSNTIPTYTRSNVDEELISKYRHFFLSFTSVKICFRYCGGYYGPPFLAQLVKDMIFTGKLQCMDTKTNLPTTIPLRFMRDYFFSKSCRRLTTSCETSLTSKIIKRWKTMDPRTLAPYKLFDDTTVRFDSIKSYYIDNSMNEIPLNSADPKVMEMIETKVAKRTDIHSMHHIQHPTDPSCSIYVVFRRESWAIYYRCFLLFV
uniref:F-box domain-containing protein n=1 Tax=Steinernema glaseri TaxID=37863 RepID=A0A1I8A3Q3_9BILA